MTQTFRTRTRSIRSGLSILALTCFSSGLFFTDALKAEETKQSFTSAVLDPIWQTEQLREPILFLQEEGQLPTGKLFFTPKKIVAVESATRKIVFEEGTDFRWDAEKNQLVLPEGSRIPRLTTEELYPLMTSDTPKIGKPGAPSDTGRGVYFDNKDGYHQLQVEVIYETEPGQWKGPVTKYATDSLPHTTANLKQAKPVKIFLLGDSISEGYNASAYSKAAPGCPAYGELTAMTLESATGSDVDFRNFAVGGWQASQGVKRVDEEKLAEEKPDLVIIAFGMNDVWRKDAAAFKKNIKEIIDAFRAKNSECEFLLISTMLGNENWGMPMDQFYTYRTALKELTGPGIALADLTAVWEEFLKRKTFYDLTGNGVNHPNDFGHIIYAQVLSRMLLDDSAYEVN
ncbi:GDSL-like Lipase/Acylhydrolase [Polystyrenella longa]|uniref:GDSL-like Lipase/Acylhydrolase n=1 Tax=Polystyrenella longa TaxID=2528007 RepID=A0A518CJJ4_9PLAN|nr:SGNH/GDSL hydrolase family protein [Polystyrenella longa]QDU79395.1 GDSL-like Lipase/Acylhydrolase [Polystyrenella longa]